MIPLRIKMSGFLSYKDEQEVRFDSAPVWMLAGGNGSGKSSVFDAVTYALFGHHRGGGTNATELINKESTSLGVEFDFRLDGQVYRIKRTLRKTARSTSTSQQIFTQTSPGDWSAISDTDKRVTFDQWIHEHIGLDYETFTSSVLLLQGKAEKLLDARPSGRAEVLAGIVDLERYQRLYERANSEKLQRKSQLEAIAHQVAVVPEVPELEYAAAEMAIDERTAERTEVEKRLSALAEREAQAHRYADLLNRRTSAQTRLKQAEALLSEAVKIEAEHARWDELRQVLPAIDVVARTRQDMKASERATEGHLRDRDKYEETRRLAATARDQAIKRKATLRGDLDLAEKKLDDVRNRLRTLQGILERVRLVEQQSAELGRLTEERSRLPADPDAVVKSTHDAFEQLTELHRVLPILERFAVLRHKLATTREESTRGEADLARLKVDGEKCKDDVKLSEDRLAKATLRKTQADQAGAVARTLRDQARQAQTLFASQQGNANCSACGQPLTESHRAEEQARRQSELTRAEKHLSEAEREVADAEQAHTEATTALTTARARLDELRDQYRTRKGQLDQSAREIKEAIDNLALMHAELSEPFRSRIAATPPADWTATKFPERDELIGYRRDVGTLEAARRRWKEAVDQQTRARDLQTRLDAARETLDRVKVNLPAGDPAQFRQESQDLQASETTLANTVKGAKLAIEQADREADKQGQQANAAATRITELIGLLQTEETSRRHWAEAVDRAVKSLPENWRQRVQAGGLAEYSAWKSEFTDLQSAGIEGRFRALSQTRLGLAALRQEVADLDVQIDAVPPAARVTPEELRTEMTTARQELSKCDQALREAVATKDRFDGYKAQRAKLGDETRRLDGEFHRYKTLAELFGRDKLQRHLVRRAERQIVDYANAVLDRLSGGQLFLKLVGQDDGADKALDLECANRVTGGAPINVAFLSGSQKFRVAVSLALGIGQYASRQHRPIESVIIDEGFGCLDRQGRQVMIQELQNLRGHLHCILLVSHQEEFADAFPDGYRFELQNGATKVSRFQR